MVRIFPIQQMKQEHSRYDLLSLIHIAIHQWNLSYKSTEEKKHNWKTKISVILNVYT